MKILIAFVQAALKKVAAVIDLIRIFNIKVVPDVSREQWHNFLIFLLLILNNTAKFVILKRLQDGLLLLGPEGVLVVIVFRHDIKTSFDFITLPVSEGCGPGLLVELLEVRYQVLYIWESPCIVFMAKSEDVKSILN